MVGRGGECRGKVGPVVTHITQSESNGRRHPVHSLPNCLLPSSNDHPANDVSNIGGHGCINNGITDGAEEEPNTDWVERSVLFVCVLVLYAGEEVAHNLPSACWKRRSNVPQRNRAPDDWTLE